MSYQVMKNKKVMVFTALLYVASAGVMMGTSPQAFANTQPTQVDDCDDLEALGFSLEPAKEVPQEIKPTQAVSFAKKQAPIAPVRSEELNTQVSSFVTQLLAPENKAVSPEVQGMLDRVDNLGVEQMRDAAQVSSRLLDLPMIKMDKDGYGSGKQVAQQLMKLKNTVTELDPTRQEGTLKGLWTKVTNGNPAAQYFQKFQSSKSHLDSIVEGLENGKESLLLDVAALKEEQQNNARQIEQLNEAIALVEGLDQEVTARLPQLREMDPEKARIVEEELLFRTRQKHQDLSTQLAVNIQSALNIQVLIKNNQELVKGVDRAATTTMSALRTAVITSQALNNQKLVLDQVQGVNSLTSNLIASNAKTLKTQGVEIQKQAMNTMIDVKDLQTAFTEVGQALDAISDFRVKSLPVMEANIAALKVQTQKGVQFLDKHRNAVLEHQTQVMDSLPAPDAKKGVKL